MKIIKLSLVIALFASILNAQKISPLLVGTNVWYNPNDLVWNFTRECGVQTIRIGGASYDKKMPTHETLMGWNGTVIHRLPATLLLMAPKIFIPA